MQREELLRWARREAQAWFDQRHDVHREPIDEVVARAYLTGAIDALQEKLAEQTAANLARARALSVLELSPQ